jgi:hypothetical protein
VEEKMIRTIDIIIIFFALFLFAWMFRYEVSGYVGNGDSSIARPVVLDRWTGKIYIPHINTAEE